MTIIKRAVFFLAGSLVVFFTWLSFYAVKPYSQVAPHDVEVIIPKETNFAGIRRILVENHVLRDDIRFVLLARLTGVAHKLKAGEYSINPGQSPYQILMRLAQGRVIQRAVTIPEGVDMKQIANIWADGGWVNRDRFLKLAADQTMIRELGLDVENLEGYLFPDTYNLAKGNQDEAGIIKMMVNRFKEVYNDIQAATKNESTLSRHQVLTLASIVEKETGQPGERPLIARVFLNRLKKNMRLQADPTVIYGQTNFSGNLTRLHLREPTPYNTYTNKGLPPGPIANPGRAAIEAVLKPADGNYLYFVSRNDGTHYFSETLAEHNRAVARYQKARFRKR